MTKENIILVMWGIGLIGVLWKVIIWALSKHQHHNNKKSILHSNITYRAFMIINTVLSLFIGNRVFLLLSQKGISFLEGSLFNRLYGNSLEIIFSSVMSFMLCMLLLSCAVYDVRNIYIKY